MRPYCRDSCDEWGYDGHDLRAWVQAVGTYFYLMKRLKVSTLDHQVSRGGVGFLNMFDSATHARAIENQKECDDCYKEMDCNTRLV